MKDLIDKPETVWPLLGINPKKDAGDEIAEVDSAKEDARFDGAPEPARFGLDPLRDPALQRFAIRTLLLEAMRFHKRDSESKPVTKTEKQVAA